MIFFRILVTMPLSILTPYFNYPINVLIKFISLPNFRLILQFNQIRLRNSLNTIK